MAELTFAGIPAAQYHIEAGTSDVEVYAAGEMASYIEKITGQKPTGDNKIVLAIDGSLPEEGYKTDCKPGLLSITGGSGRGLLYGVYSLFETVGVRYLTPDIETLGDGGDIPEGVTEWAPVFEYRQSDWFCGRDPAWCVKNKINSIPNDPDCMGGDANKTTDPFAIPKYMGGYVRWNGFVHSIAHITETDAKLLPQPCFSDPENLRKAKAYVRRVLKEDPDIRVIDVSQNDNSHGCTCPRCAAIDAEEGSQMGSLLRFINAVADDIKDDYPDVAIETLAYVHTRKPPKITKPRDNVIIRLCSIECRCGNSLLSHEQDANEEFCRDVEEWEKICNRLYIWDYVTNFRYYIPTFPNLDVLCSNMRYFAMHHVKGMYPEGNYNSISGEFGELRAYVQAKMMAEPMQYEYEYRHAIDDFLEGYYGAGWYYIRTYINFMLHTSRGEFVCIWTDPFEHFDYKRLAPMTDEIEHWWDMAEKLAGDKLENVKRSRLQWTFILLMLRPDPVKGKAFHDDVNARGILWSEGRKIRKDVDFSLPPSKWIE